jgi:NADH:ubiquinone reductase (non-electrogenic)
VRVEAHLQQQRRQRRRQQLPVLVVQRSSQHPADPPAASIAPPSRAAPRRAPPRPACCRENLVESAEDIGSHWRRSIKELPTTKAFDKLVGKGGRLRLKATKPVVLVLGSGWGAHSLMKVGGPGFGGIGGSGIA